MGLRACCASRCRLKSSRIHPSPTSSGSKHSGTTPEPEPKSSAPEDEGEYDEWVAGIEGEDDEVALEQLRSWLLPKTDGFFQAPSGHRLHIRAVLPPSDPEALGVKAVVLYCHGMNSHVNAKPWAEGVFPQIAAEGFAVIAVDIHGHGYSEGTRALVDDWRTVFDDWEGLAEAFMGVADPAPSQERFCGGVPDEVLERLRRLPLFVMGVSMGGMIGMYVGLRLQASTALRDSFRGAVLCCPALAVDVPPRVVQVLLRSLVIPLRRTRTMPASLSSSSKVKASWSVDLSDPRQREVAAMDIRDCAARFPGVALGWHRGIRWATAGAFSKLFSRIERDMEEISYPLLVVHDPGDKICFFTGSQRLMEKCASEDKLLEVAEAKGLHTVPIVAQDKFVASTTSWMRQRA